MELFAVGLALALGFVLGLIVGARRSINLLLAARAVDRASAHVASLMPPTLPTRSAADILAGRIRVVLGTTTYDLPVLPRGPSRRWIEQLDVRFALLLASLAEAGNDEVLEQLTSEADALYEMLLSYDQSSVLPSRDEIDEAATDAQILQAVIEVWRAANPLVASAVATLATAGPSSGPPSLPPIPTASAPTTSTTS